MCVRRPPLSNMKYRNRRSHYITSRPTNISKTRTRRRTDRYAVSSILCSLRGKKNIKIISFIGFAITEHTLTIKQLLPPMDSKQTRGLYALLKCYRYETLSYDVYTRR